MLVLVGMRPCCFTEPRRIALPPGQAQGPHPSPHPPLVPTGRDYAHYCIRLSKFIRMGLRALLYSVVKVYQDGATRIPRFGCQSLSGRGHAHSPIRLSKFIRTEAGVSSYSPIRLPKRHQEGNTRFNNIRWLRITRGCVVNTMQTMKLLLVDDHGPLRKALR